MAGRRSPRAQCLAERARGRRPWPRPKRWSIEYVRAGFRKIHLDCSMACADDPTPLPEPTIAGRAARLARIAEAAWQRAGGEAPVYVIGTEVPVPGGAAEELAELAVTTPRVGRDHDRNASPGISPPRDSRPPGRASIALVVQPGVEFDHHKVDRLRPEKARGAQGQHRRRSPDRVRGALDRLPDAAEPRGAGARPFRHPEGRSRRRRSRCARRCGRWPRSSSEMPGIGAACGPSRGHARASCAQNPRPMARALPRRRQRIARPAVQPERSHPLLLARIQKWPRACGRLFENLQPPRRRR